jgi:hypothetical protein
MRGMDLDAGEAGLLAKPRRIDEARHHLVDMLLGHRFQRRKHFRMLAEVKRHGRWRPGFLQLVTPPSTSRATLNRSAWLLSLSSAHCDGQPDDSRHLCTQTRRGEGASAD